ncbi:MAG TPA: hypothetical protein VMG59_04820 [Phycisphaerae bacterium]|nr:hypothetical protein [Phycisphaerae bacterium]
MLIGEICGSFRGLRLFRGLKPVPSPLMDARRFTHNLEAAYRDMWRKWYSGIAEKVEN